MKKFLLKLLVFTTLIVLITTMILNRYGGAADYFYTKFTSPKQHAMIVGDSRSFQGMQPAVIDANISGFEKPMYNYSFTVAQASYGDAYLESILKKLDKSTTDGLFILSVHPFLLAQRDKDNFSKGIYFESNVPPNNMHFVAMNPNPEYFFRNFSYFHLKAIFRQVSKVHDDGWLELRNIPKDSASAHSLTADECKTYSGFAAKWKPSGYRLRKLSETVQELQQYGRVVLVRMPISRQILSIEKGFWPDFDSDIEKIAKQNAAVYVNYAKSKKAFPTFDGIHMDNETGAAFTQSLCDSINKRLPERNSLK